MLKSDLGNIVKRLSKDLNENPANLMDYVAKKESELYTERTSRNAENTKKGFYYSAIGRVRNMYKEYQGNLDKKAY